jgi:F-type H+-transporting ATPase subunit b
MIMRWVNFIILAALIIKYARKPLTNFLNQQRDEVAALIKRYEGQKKEAELKIQEGRRQLAESEQRLKIVEERIIAEGQRRKAAAIEAARSESRIMIEAAQGKIEGQIREAYGILRGEIIDLATEKALSKISSVINDEDQDRLVHLWLDAARP